MLSRGGRAFGSAVSDKGNSAAGLWRRLDSAVSEIDQGIQALWPDYTHDNAMTYDMTHDQPEYHLWITTRFT